MRMEVIETIKILSGLERTCPPVVVAHLPMAGLHVFGNPTVDLRGPSRYSRRSSSDWHRNGGRLSTLVASPVIGHLTDTELIGTQFQDNYRQNNYNAKP